MNTLAQTEATIVALNALLRLREQEVSGLRAELAACREDAEKWRAYAARKRAVIDAGMGKIILRDAARKGEGE